ncbi:lipopolysaccharide biosynthesis protein [Chitinophaga sp. GCM10012297]|uniref:Flippase n=1 Tax=Chitinophaga chungangae TaxID=2821488 RepID=A0ABS3YIG9_9BACT|nr:flippase [Chitinophaga chungangae]MBO9154225.1 flippase [Chitinophaga chungangae]
MSEPKYTYWLRSGIYSGMQKVAVLLFGIGSVLLLTRSLTKSDMGVWNLFLLFAGIIEIVRQSLIKNAVIKYINSHGSEEHPGIQSAALAINVVVTLLIGLLLAALIFPASRMLNAPQLSEIIYIFLPGLLLLIPFSHFEWLQNAHADFRGIFWAYSLRQGLSFFLIVAHLLTVRHIQLVNLIWYYNFGIAGGTVLSFIFARKFLHTGMNLTGEWVKKLWHFGKYVFGTNISSSIFRNTDQVVVASMVSTSAVALYGVCVRISNLVDVPSQVLGDILFPKSAKMMETGNLEGVKYYYEKAVGVILALAVPASLCIMMLPRLVLTIIAGKEYQEAAAILQVTIFYGLFLPFIKQFGTIMDSIGQPKLNFFVITFTAVFNIGSCITLSHFFGIMGAAYGSMLSYAVCLAITQTILIRKLKINPVNIWKYMFRFYPEMYRIFRQRFILKPGTK